MITILCIVIIGLAAYALLQRKLVRDTSAQLRAADKRYAELHEQVTELMTPTLRSPRAVTMYSILGGK